VQEEVLLWLEIVGLEVMAEGVRAASKCWRKRIPDCRSNDAHFGFVYSMAKPKILLFYGLGGCQAKRVDQRKLGQKLSGM